MPIEVKGPFTITLDGKQLPVSNVEIGVDEAAGPDESAVVALQGGTFAFEQVFDLPDADDVLKRIKALVPEPPPRALLVHPALFDRFREVAALHYPSLLAGLNPEVLVSPAVPRGSIVELLEHRQRGQDAPALFGEVGFRVPDDDAFRYPVYARFAELPFSPLIPIRIIDLGRGPFRLSRRQRVRERVKRNRRRREIRLWLSQARRESWWAR